MRHGSLEHKYYGVRVGDWAWCIRIYGGVGMGDTAWCIRT